MATNDQFVWELTTKFADALKPHKLIPFGVITIYRTELLSKALKLMVDANILSVPVLDSATNKYYGIIDMLNIVSFINQNFANYNFNTFNEFKHVSEAVLNFHNSTVEDVINGPWFVRSTGNLVTCNYSLYSVFELLSKGYKRVCVTDLEYNIRTIVTQSMTMDFIAENINLVHNVVLRRKVKSLTLHEPSPVLVNEWERPLNAFHKMANHGINSVGVIDGFGALVDVISIRDVRGLQLDNESIWRLFGNIKEFKSAIRARYPTTTPDKVVKISFESTLEECINQVIKNRVHQLYVLDTEYKPILCITLRDILYNIVFRPPSPFEA